MSVSKRLTSFRVSIKRAKRTFSQNNSLPKWNAISFDIGLITKLLHAWQNIYILKKYVPEKNHQQNISFFTVPQKTYRRISRLVRKSCNLPQLNANFWQWVETKNKFSLLAFTKSIKDVQFRNFLVSFTKTTKQPGFCSFMHVKSWKVSPGLVLSLTNGSRGKNEHVSSSPSWTAGLLSILISLVLWAFGGTSCKGASPG